MNELMDRINQILNKMEKIFQEIKEESKNLRYRPKEEEGHNEI